MQRSKCHAGPRDHDGELGSGHVQQGRDCSNVTYSAGQVAIEETGVIHRARNLGATKTEFWVTFLDLPDGSPRRIEAETDPGWIVPS